MTESLFCRFWLDVYQYLECVKESYDWENTVAMGREEGQQARWNRKEMRDSQGIRKGTDSLGCHLQAT